MEKKKTQVDTHKEFLASQGLDGVIGIDVANSTIKAWYEDGKSISYRNTVKEIDDAGLVYSFKTDYHMFVVENAVYEVGDISVTGSGARGNSRYGSKTFKVETLIGIASIVPAGERIRLRVVTGVPSSLSKNYTVLENVKRSLLGSYTVKSVYFDKHEDVEFDIVDVMVVAQPLGTLYTYLCDEDGYINEKLVEQKALVIDIGWGTTDIAVLESGRVSSTFSFEIGVSDYITGVREAINNDMPEANIQALNPHELDSKLLDSPIVETPFGSFDLTKYREEEKARQSGRLVQEVMSLGLSFNRFYKIILSGGGSLLYKKYLLEKFNDPRVVIRDDAIIANSKGFYLLGSQE